MSVIDTNTLHEELRLLQRGHHVLASIMHFYVHSLPSSEHGVVIPKSVAVPLVKISRGLGMAPALTFADTVLWNWEYVNPDLPLSIKNMRYPNTFSGTEAERNFYLTSAAVELRGAEMLKIFEIIDRARDKHGNGLGVWGIRSSRGKWISWVSALEEAHVGHRTVAERAGQQARGAGTAREWKSPDSIGIHLRYGEVGDDSCR